MNYPANSSLLLGVFDTWIEVFKNALECQPDKQELDRHLKECCWAIILASEFTKKSQEQRIKTKDLKQNLDCDFALCSRIFYISQMEGLDEESHIQRSLMIFFRSFTEAYFLDIHTDSETTASLCDGKWSISVGLFLLTYPYSDCRRM